MLIISGSEAQMNLDKEQVASRQLDAAIKLMFSGGDIVSVHTLASASSAIFSDLLHATGSSVWRDEIVKCYPGREKEVIEVLRHAQNFFKHADKDPYGKIEFEEVTNDETIIVSTLEYGELLRLNKKSSQKLTTPMSIFQMWYFAKAPEILLSTPDRRGKNFVEQAQRHFPNLGLYPRFQQLALGAAVLERELQRYRGRKN